MQFHEMSPFCAAGGQMHAVCCRSTVPGPGLRAGDGILSGRRFFARLMQMLQFA